MSSVCTAFCCSVTSDKEKDYMQGQTVSIFHLKMQVVNFKTITNENPTYTTWHSHAGRNS